MRNYHQNLMRVGDGRKAWIALGLLTVFCACMSRASFAHTAEKTTEGVTQDNLVQLDGSVSGAKAGEKIFYKWKQIDGPKAQLLNPNSAKPSFYAQQSGRYSFELTVSDGKTVSAPAVVNVEVDKLNRAPVLQLPKRLDVREGEDFTLDASGTRDPDGDELRYLWRQISGPVVLGRDGYTARPLRTLRAEQNGVYIFEVTATDGTTKSAPVRCEVVVARNLVPIAKASAAGGGVSIRKITVTARTGEDKIDGDFTALNEESGAIGDDGFPIPSGDDLLENSLEEGPETSFARKYKPQNRTETSVARMKNSSVKASEPTAGTTKSRSASASGQSADKPQKLTASTSQDFTAEVGERVTIQGYGISPEGKRLKYIWRQTAGLPLSRDILNRSQNLEFIPAEAGTYIFELLVSDGLNYSEPAVVKVTVAGVNENLMGLVDGAESNDEQYNNVKVPAIAPRESALNVKREPEDIEVPGASSAPGSNGNGRGLFSRIFKNGK